jgi:nicotinamidase/pyrazinamidase
MNVPAFGLIDCQSGFMPISEGIRLNKPGFGELEVANGQEIIEPVNLLLAEFARCNRPTFTTQDWHPENTAHFNLQPNFKTSWPVHCVAYTPGADIHPEINIPSSATRFVKGTESHVLGKYDTSYSGYNAYQLVTELTLPSWLRHKKVDNVVLGGLALDYCVMQTAVDILDKAGIKVSIVRDATRSVAPETEALALTVLENIGIEFITVDQAFALAR